MKNPELNHHCDIAVIGGGASGMAAAWYAQRTGRLQQGPALNIALFERNDRLGKKLLSTGNGRCNLTNLDGSIGRFHGTDPSFARRALSRFPPSKVISLFEEVGLICTVEEDRKVFPASLHASAVLDALRCALDENDVQVHTAAKITAVAPDGNRFTLATAAGELFTASAVVIAAGGRCAPATGSDGNGYKLASAFSHQCTCTVPAIVQLTTDTTFVKPLAGHKIRGTATLHIGGKPVREEQGEILFTDYGLSGPPILQLSGYAARAFGTAGSPASIPGIRITLDFLPDYSLEETAALLTKRKNLFPGRKLEEYLTGLFQRRLGYALMKASLHKPLSGSVAGLSDDEIAALARACKELSVAVTGTMSFAHAQTTAGGLATSSFDPSTMESRNRRGLFACGELLDIDGDCGGFNLQWAWASGFLAGSSAVASLAGTR